LKIEKPNSITRGKMRKIRDKIEREKKKLQTSIIRITIRARVRKRRRITTKFTRLVIVGMSSTTAG
jgi:hypothetical protein